MVRRVLFVCRANQDRSSMAERLFRKIVEQTGYKIYPEQIRDFDFEIASAGTDAGEYGTQVYPELLGRFTEIFAMDDEVYREIRENYGIDEGKIFNLGVSDLYSSDYKMLEWILFDKLLPFARRTLQEVVADGK